MYHILINPASRSGRGLKLWKEIVEPALQEEGVAYRSYLSGKARDIEKLAGEITADASEDLTLVILGGDGTMNEALRGISDFSRVTLGYIPTGSSNDLARDLKIPRDPRQALDLILHTGQVRSMDMGVMTAPDCMVRPFAVSCGIGFDAAVCEEVFQTKMKGFFNRLGLGKLTYLAVAIKELFSAKDALCQFLLDETEAFQVRRFLFNACMIHRYEGGGFQFCPDAKDNDGILDLCTVGGIPKLLILFALPTAFFGKHYMFHGVDAHRAAKVHIVSSIPLCVHTDGEVAGHYSELTVECRKNILRFLA